MNSSHPQYISNQRLYWDYNATSPLAPSVSQWLAQEGKPFANPSSAHTSGKNSLRFISETRDFLLRSLGVEQSHEIVFSSGATESINTVVKGFCWHHHKGKKGFAVICTVADHAAMQQQQQMVEELGGIFVCLPIQANGEFSHDSLREELQRIGEKPVLLSWTLMNNETGVVWPLEEVVPYKQQYPQLLIHADAVQWPGRVALDVTHYSIPSEIDYYTFSGHKFGAMKGIGWTFLKKQTLWNPLFHGGGQQQGWRSGTENLWGIYSLKLAWEFLRDHQKWQEVQIAKLWFEQQLQQRLQERGSILGIHAPHRNINTITFSSPEKADIVLTALDMKGIEVGRGSACSSGSTEANPIALAMGFNASAAKRIIRLSFSPYWTMTEAQSGWQRFSEAIQRFF